MKSIFSNDFRHKYKGYFNFLQIFSQLFCLYLFLLSYSYVYISLYQNETMIVEDFIMVVLLFILEDAIHKIESIGV